MAQTTDLKYIIKNLGTLFEKGPKEASFLELFQIWMAITDMEFQDVLHIKQNQMWSDLTKIYTQFKGVLDVLHDDQIQEAACRTIQNFKFHGDVLGTDAATAVHSGVSLNWDGNAWVYITDASTRLRQTSDSYVKAVNDIQEYLGKK